ncbi:MAG: tyrosine-type recombinase/integrase [Notoacmeibacter sp.]|nr:tyrosine-type recombinase/integrase [Notoacmeibacter sp.]
MPLRKYKRGRYWWLEGTATGGDRIHESTRQVDEKVAEQVRIRREAQLLDVALMGEKATYSFAQAVNLYLDNGGQARFIRRLLEHFGETPLAKITGADVRAAAKAIYPNAAYPTWNRQVVIPMRAIVNCAADAKKADKPVFKGFTAKTPGSRKSNRPPPVAVDRTYIDAVRAHLEHDPWVRAMLLFTFQTAARRGDMLALKWRNVDLERKVVRFVDMKNGETAETELTEEMTRELAGLERRNAFVFDKRTPKSIYARLQEACEKADVPYLGLHQPGRHSFATELVVNHGVDLPTAKELGRWKTTRVLAENYAHGRARGIIETVFGVPDAPKKSGETDKN